MHRAGKGPVPTRCRQPRPVLEAWAPCRGFALTGIAHRCCPLGSADLLSSTLLPARPTGFATLSPARLTPTTMNRMHSNFLRCGCSEFEQGPGPWQSLRMPTGQVQKVSDAWGSPAWVALEPCLPRRFWPGSAPAGVAVPPFHEPPPRANSTGSPGPAVRVGGLRVQCSHRHRAQALDCQLRMTFSPSTTFPMAKVRFRGRTVARSQSPSRLLWVGCRLSLRPEESQLQLSKPALTVPLSSPLSALTRHGQGPDRRSG
jgi:hypothetical protein